MLNPKVTVLMPVYNGEKYLQEAINSILEQTFTDFEFLIINDGSTDGSGEIIQSYHDGRIRLVRNETHIGLTPSLNKGIDLALGKYIARMDCDDISLPNRLEKQVIFMEFHPDVGVCGTWARVIDEKGDIKGKVRSPARYAAGTLCWRPSPFIHPTCMIRTDLLMENKYNPDYTHAQDYELWLRLCRKTSFFNIAQFLLLYRKHPGSITQSKREMQLASSYKAFSQFIGGKKISYEGFLALIPVEAKINPLMRAYYWWLVSKKTGFDCITFVVDNLIYLKLWLFKDSESK